MKKLTVILSVLAVIFLALSIYSASYSLSRTEAAIDTIGAVSFDEASRDKIDLADSYYKELDPKLNPAERVGNLDVLEAAKNEYIRLAIKTAVVKDQRKVADGYTNEEVTAAVAAAREALDHYYGVDELQPVVENYSDLLALEEKYAVSGNSDEEAAPESSDSENSEESVELC